MLKTEKPSVIVIISFVVSFHKLNNLVIILAASRRHGSGVPPPASVTAKSSWSEPRRAGRQPSRIHGPRCSLGSSSGHHVHHGVPVVRRFHGCSAAGEEQQGVGSDPQTLSTRTINYYVLSIRFLLTKPKIVVKTICKAMSDNSSSMKLFVIKVNAISFAQCVIVRRSRRHVVIVHLICSVLQKSYAIKSRVQSRCDSCRTASLIANCSELNNWDNAFVL